MKKLSKVVVVLVFMFSFTISAIAKDEDAKFSLSDTTYSIDEVEELKEEHKQQALSYKKGLSACYDFGYVTNVEENDETFDTITVERAAEKDAVVEEKEEEGYTVTAEEKLHDAEVEEFEFNTLNGRVRTATKDGEATNSYYYRSIDGIIASDQFSDYEDEDMKIVNTVTDEREDVSESEIRTTASQARSYLLTLLMQGYSANMAQNNTERTNFEITSRRRINNNQIQTIARNQAATDNPNKEILDLRFDNNNNPTVVSEEHTSLEEAEEARTRLNNTGLYERVEVVSEVDDTDSSLVATEQEVDWTSTSEEPYFEDVYTDNVVTGYRYFYLQEKVLEEAQNVTVERLTRNQCNAMLNSTEYANWQNKECTRVGNGPFATYTFNASKDAVTTLQGYYDEYQYAVKYIVNAYYYRYTGSYIATDYTVSYTGNRGTVRIVKETYDKYNEINGTRKLYNVVTTGTKQDNGSCVTTSTTDDEKTVNTGVRENTYYKVVLLSSLLVLVTTISLRKKLCK